MAAEIHEPKLDIEGVIHCNYGRWTMKVERIQSGSLESVRVHFCPFCGLPLDGEREGHDHAVIKRS